MDSPFLRFKEEEISAYHTGIHFGYEAKFRERVKNLYNQLREKQIHSEDIALLWWPGSSNQVTNTEKVKAIARALFRIAADIDIATEEAYLPKPSKGQL
jgi:hypothetical protein